MFDYSNGVEYTLYEIPSLLSGKHRTWQKPRKQSDKRCSIHHRQPTPSRRIRRSTIVSWPSTLRSSRLMKASSHSRTRRPSPPWRNSLMRRRRILIPFCRFPISPRISPRCSGAPPSTLPLALLAPFSPRSTRGEHAKRSTRPKQATRARKSSRSESGHPSRSAPGTSQFLSTQACGKNT